MSDRQFSAREIRLLIGLADGSLPPEQREAAERELLGDPDRAAALERQRRGLLAEQADGVPYPDWTAAFGWAPEGARVDELADRRAETVFYEHDGHVIGYTIIEGDPLEPPRDARRVVRGGGEMHAWTAGPRDVVAFERDGRTCVLSGEVLAQETLLRLAAWRPGTPGSGADPHA